jgi:Pyruvate/2-oxoacid:ferredoxin oxidoreductase delta subunit
MIAVDASKCIGCFSCSNVCPSKIITATEEGMKKTIHFGPCEEYCDICVESCPEKALSLVPKETDTKITFDLVSCKVCKKGFATEPMLRKVKSSIPEQLQTNADGVCWIEICPICRREMESEKASSQIVMKRRAV